MEVIAADTVFDAQALINAYPMIQALLLDWDLEDEEHKADHEHRPARAVLDTLRERNANVPVFLFTDRENAAQVPLDVLRRTNDFIWLFEDTATFIAGRILAAVRNYRENALPPMFMALLQILPGA